MELWRQRIQLLHVLSTEEVSRPYLSLFFPVPFVLVTVERDVIFVKYFVKHFAVKLLILRKYSRQNHTICGEFRGMKVNFAATILFAVLFVLAS